MNKGVNKAVVLGYLGQDPEVHYTTNGDPVTNLSIATGESWTDKGTGEIREKTEWHRVVLFGKLAEVAGEYLSKGSQVYIEGKLQTRKWQDQNGQDRYSTEIVVQGFGGVMQMLGEPPVRPQQQGGQRQGGWGQPQQPQQPSQHRQQNRPQQRNPNRKPQQRQIAPHQTAPQYNEPPMDFDEDIPFAFIGLQYPMLLHCCG